MCFFKHFISIFLFCLSVTYSPYALSKTDSPELSAYRVTTELTLKNGLRVCLKKSNLEPKEFDFQLFALGGFGHLCVADQPSARLSADIAWESGLEPLTGDELDCALDDHGIEMSIILGCFDHQIKATGPTSELPYCLQLTRLLFTQPQFSQVGLKKILNNNCQKFHQKELTGQIADEQTALKINLRNWHILNPLNRLDLERIELEKAQHFFKKFFHNPAEFTLMIIGDFDQQEIVELLEKSLGSLPSYPVTKWNPPSYPSFPKGHSKKEFQGITRYKESLTRLTFPLSTSIKDPATLDFLCFILKQEINAALSEKKLEKTCLNVSYSFPLFPYLDPCWLVIKFSSAHATIEPICQTMIKKLEHMKQEDVSKETKEMAFQELAKKYTRMPDNAYVLSLLADYYRAGWDLEPLYRLSNQDSQQQEELFKKAMDCYPSLNQYSIILFHP